MSGADGSAPAAWHTTPQAPATTAIRYTGQYRPHGTNYWHDVPGAEKATVTAAQDAVTYWLGTLVFDRSPAAAECRVVQRRVTGTQVCVMPACREV